MVHGGRLLAPGRAGVHGRREGRRRRPGDGRRAERQDPAARRADRHRGLHATRPARWCSGTSTARRGHPVRTTVSEIGPSLLGRILELNDTQAGVLEIAFKLADDRGLLLLDLDDLRALLGVRRRQPQGDLDPVRARQHAVDRRDPARAARARARGRRGVLRRAGARPEGPDAHGSSAAAASSTSSRPTS